MGSDFSDLEIFGANLDVSFLCIPNLIPPSLLVKKQYIFNNQRKKPQASFLLPYFHILFKFTIIVYETFLL